MKTYRILLTLYLVISGTIFLLVGVFHFFRLVHRWSIVVGSTTIPQILSCVGLPVAIAYALCALWLWRRSSKPADDAGAVH